MIEQLLQSLEDVTSRSLEDLNHAFEDHLDWMTECVNRTREQKINGQTISLYFRPPSALKSRYVKQPLQLSPVKVNKHLKTPQKENPQREAFVIEKPRETPILNEQIVSTVPSKPTTPPCKPKASKKVIATIPSLSLDEENNVISEPSKKQPTPKKKQQSPKKQEMKPPVEVKKPILIKQEPTSEEEIVEETKIRSRKTRKNRRKQVDQKTNAKTNQEESCKESTNNNNTTINSTSIINNTNTTIASMEETIIQNTTISAPIVNIDSIVVKQELIEEETSKMNSIINENVQTQEIIKELEVQPIQENKIERITEVAPIMEEEPVVQIAQEENNLESKQEKIEEISVENKEEKEEKIEETENESRPVKEEEKVVKFEVLLEHKIPEQMEENAPVEDDTANQFAYVDEMPSEIMTEPMSAFTAFNLSAFDIFDQRKSIGAVLQHEEKKDNTATVVVKEESAEEKVEVNTMDESVCLIEEDMFTQVHDAEEKDEDICIEIASSTVAESLRIGELQPIQTVQQQETETITKEVVNMDESILQFEIKEGTQMEEPVEEPKTERFEITESKIEELNVNATCVNNTVDLLKDTSFVINQEYLINEIKEDKQEEKTGSFSASDLFKIKYDTFKEDPLKALQEKISSLKSISPESTDTQPLIEVREDAGILSAPELLNLFEKEEPPKKQSLRLSEVPVSPILSHGESSKTKTLSPLSLSPPPFEIRESEALETPKRDKSKSNIDFNNIPNIQVDEMMITPMKERERTPPPSLMREPPTVSQHGKFRSVTPKPSLTTVDDKKQSLFIPQDNNILPRISTPIFGVPPQFNLDLTEDDSNIKRKFDEVISKDANDLKRVKLSSGNKLSISSTNSSNSVSVRNSSHSSNIITGGKSFMQKAQLSKQKKQDNSKAPKPQINSIKQAEIAKKKEEEKKNLKKLRLEKQLQAHKIKREKEDKLGEDKSFLSQSSQQKPAPISKPNSLYNTTQNKNNANKKSINTKTNETNIKKNMPTPKEDVYSSYELSDEYDSSEDEEDAKKRRQNKKVPSWAQGDNLRHLIKRTITIDPDRIFASVKTCDLEQIFQTNNTQLKQRFRERTSSRNWTHDHFTIEEELQYKEDMGFLY
ncbi:hypothetical protein ABK040_007717 [Willaertia magna]